MPTGEKVAFQPPLARMFAEDLHYPPVRCHVVVLGESLRHPRTVRDIEQYGEPVGLNLIRAEHSEIARFRVELHYVAEKTAHDPCRFSKLRPWLRDLNGVSAEIGNVQGLEQ